MHFQLLDPPTGDVVALADVKVDLRIDTNDFDGEIAAWIAAAVERLQSETRRQLLTATWLLTLDTFPRQAIPIWKAPITEIEAIEYIDPAGDLQELDSSDYLVSLRDEPRLIVPAAGCHWPATARQPDAVRITCVAGYGTSDDVPALATALIKLMVREQFAGCELNLDPLLNQLRWTDHGEIP